MAVDLNTRCVLIDGNELYQRALSLSEDFSKGSHWNEWQQAIHCKKRLVAWNTEQVWIEKYENFVETEPIDEELSNAFLAELKNFIEEKNGTIWSKNQLQWNWAFLKEDAPKSILVKRQRRHCGIKQKECLTQIVHGSTAGHMIQPGRVYRLYSQTHTKIVDSCSGHKITEHGNSQLVYIMVLLMLHLRSGKYLEEEELEFKFPTLKIENYPESLLWN